MCIRIRVYGVDYKITITRRSLYIFVKGSLIISFVDLVKVHLGTNKPVGEVKKPPNCTSNKHIRIFTLYGLIKQIAIENVNATVEEILNDPRVTRENLNGNEKRN